MKLKQWMHENRWTPATLGAELGVHAQTISRYTHGDGPEWPVMRAIAVLSDGQVMPSDFLFHPGGKNDAS